MRNFFSELKRRKVYRVAVAYAVVAWLLAQVATQVFPFFEIPNWAVRLVIVVLILGFPVALILSWAFDITPEGIKRTDDMPPKQTGPSAVPEKSIAVLPFENLSDDQQNTYFADGIQDDILSNRERASMQIHPTNDLAAYELFLRARDLFRWSGVGDPLENGKKALRLIDQAVARDPQFALAYCLGSRVNAELYWFGHDRNRARLNNAKAAADVALRLQPDLGDAHLALAFFYYLGHRDYKRARSEIKVAQQATPNDAEVWDAEGAVDRRSGRWNEAIANFEKARYLDPRNFSVISNLAETFIAMRRYPEAQHAIDNALLVNPSAHFFSIERASIDLKRSGETAPLRAVMRAVPRDFDPGGAVANVGIRLSLMERDFAEAARMLVACSRDRFADSGVGG